MRRIGARKVDELLHRLRRRLLTHDEDVRHAGEFADRDEVLHRIERQVVVEADIDGKGAGGEQDGVAVRLRVGDIAHADIAAGAAAVLDDEGLARRLAQRRGDDAANEVRRAAGRVGDDDLHRPVGIGGEGGAAVEQRGRGDAGADEALEHAPARRRG
jgi:hypothetical protein